MDGSKWRPWNCQQIYIHLARAIAKIVYVQAQALASTGFNMNQLLMVSVNTLQLLLI